MLQKRHETDNIQEPCYCYHISIEIIFHNVNSPHENIKLNELQIGNLLSTKILT